MINKDYSPLILVILDGWGISNTREGNAMALANTPVMTGILKKYPHTLISASGKSVGLPPNQDGNSEAGHMNIGAGRVIEQDSVVVSHSINQGTFFNNPALLGAVDHAKKNDSTVHLMGLLTEDQSAHADPDHIIALITLLRLKKIEKVVLHLFTDGRDSYQFLSLKLLTKLQKVFTNNEKIGTIIGRFYAMDRNKEWDRTKKAYDALVLGKGIISSSPQESILQAYNSLDTDEFIKPTIISENGKIVQRISHGDAVIFFNLRSDRVRQLTKSFTQQSEFIGFQREVVLKNLYFVSLTDFGPDLPGVKAAYTSKDIKNTLPFAMKDFRQLYIAETEKYAHVTYFFNGGYDHPVVGEDRVIINSPNVKNYKDKPEMSADKITDFLINSLNNKNYDFIVVNYANADMVAHSGDLAASIKSVEIIDENLGRLIKPVLANNGTMIITGDHGNIEEIKELKTGQIDTAHSSNPVPFIIVNNNIPKNIKFKSGALSDIAPTILHLLKIKKPKEMGVNLLCKYQINQ